MTPTKQMIAISELHLNKRNYNVHSDVQIHRIAVSLKKFGQRKPLTTWHNIVLTGHGVFEAAKLLGWSEIWNEPCPDEWTETEALAWLAADNELAKLADPDLVALAAILEESKAHDAELLEAIGYSEAEFATMLDEISAPDFQEYDESVADDVEMIECPHCGEFFPK